MRPDALDLRLLAELERPDMFQRLVDSLPLGPAKVGLRLWGVLHGVCTTNERTKASVHQEALQCYAVDKSGAEADSR
jgi:hypothetical protein